MEAQRIPRFFTTHLLIPVVTIVNVDHALPVAKALLAGGIGCIEVTLRTRESMSAIALICEQLPEMIVGAGTVTQPEQVTQLTKLGVQFAVSPGFSSVIAECAATHDLPYLPGVMTPSEVMLAIDHKFSHLKFFPAEMAGGIKMLKMFGHLFPDVQFCATGGINANNMRDYLALSNIFAVGGSWFVSEQLLKDEDWAGITALAQALT